MAGQQAVSNSAKKSSVAANQWKSIQLANLICSNVGAEESRENRGMALKKIDDLSAAQ